MLIACPSCQRQLNVPDNAAGKQVRCPAPDCGTVFFVPAAPASVAPPPTPAAAPRPAAPGAARPAVRATPRPAAAPQPQASGSPFDFSGGGGVAGPQADFGFTDHAGGGLKGIGTRTRISRAAGWLNLAGGSMIIWILFFFSMVLTLTILGGWSHVFVGISDGHVDQVIVPAVLLLLFDCAPLLLLPVPIVVVIGARLLGRSRRWGFAIAASILSIVIGGLAALSAIGFAVQTVMTWMGAGLMVAAGAGGSPGAFLVIASCSNLVLLCVVGFCGIFGGIVGLRTLFNVEVKKAFS